MEKEAMSEPELVIRADWDEEARVWVASSDDVPGLAIEADSLEALKSRLTSALADLFELNGHPGADREGARIALIARSALHVPAAA